MTQEILVPESADDETVVELVASIYESAKSEHES